MAAGDADLLFDQVEIVEQPFGRRRDLAAGLDGGGQLGAGCGNDGGIVGQARQQAVGSALIAQHMPGGHILAMRSHLGCTEQFGPEREFVGRIGLAIERLAPG